MFTKQTSATFIVQNSCWWCCHLPDESLRYILHHLFFQLFHHQKQLFYLPNTLLLITLYKLHQNICWFSHSPITNIFTNQLFCKLFETISKLQSFSIFKLACVRGFLSYLYFAAGHKKLDSWICKCCFVKVNYQIFHLVKFVIVFALAGAITKYLTIFQYLYDCSLDFIPILTIFIQTLFWDCFKSNWIYKLLALSVIITFTIASAFI